MVARNLWSKRLWRTTKTWEYSPRHGNCTWYINVVPGHAIGLLFNPNAWWIGVHYSPHDKRHCINILPCITFWISAPDGKVPRR